MVLCLSGFVGVFQQKIGPLKLLMVAAVFSVASFACLYSAIYLPSSFTLLYISRALSGVSRSCITTSVYIAEVLPMEIRAMFVMLEVVSRSFGSLLVAGLGYFVDFNLYGIMFGWIPMVSFVWMLFASHESPVHLINSGQNTKALRVLNRLKSTPESADARYQAMSLLPSQKSEGQTSFYKRCAQPDVWKPFLIVSGLQIVQQFAMMGIFRTYIVTILADTFGEAQKHFAPTVDNQTNELTDTFGDDLTNLTTPGLTHERRYEPYLGAVFIGVVRLVASVTLSLMVDQHRRKRIYLTSGTYLILLYYQILF